jgi:hypothetical protein
MLFAFSIVRAQIRKVAKSRLRMSESKARNVYRLLVGKPLLKMPRRRQEGNIETVIREIGCVEWGLMDLV